MKQRIINSNYCSCYFYPIGDYREIPFLLLIYVMATIGLFELLRMKNLHIAFFRVDSFLSIAMDCVIT